MTNRDTLLTGVYFAASQEGIKPDIWAEFMSRMDELKDHNGFHYDHCLRVGLYAHGIAASEGHADCKFPLFAGVGHDIGKCEISNEVLEHKNFGPEEMEKMRLHSFAGFEALKDKFLFTALIAGLHHAYQPEGYGIKEEQWPWQFSNDTKKMVEKMARLIMICDFFDAMMTRKQKHIGEPQQIMTDFFGEGGRVDWLFANQIGVA